MGDYPDSDEEFELQYGDELELLNEQEAPDEYLTKVTNASTSRRSLHYEEPKSSSIVTQSDLFNGQSQITSQNKTRHNDLNNSFDHDFQLIQDEGTIESTSENNQNETVLIASNQSQVEPPRKRTIEELFGDIDDLIFENERNIKKMKPTSKLEEQMAMIEKILDLRKQKKEATNILFHKKIPLTTEERNKLNLSWRVPNYPFISVTNHDGEKFYVRCHSDTYEKEDITRVIADINFVGVMGDMFKETWKEAQEIINKQIDDAMETSDEPVVMTEFQNEQHLWVEVYKPKRYLELLSDESTNRILLKWIKLWDKVVFHRRPKIKPQVKAEGNKTKFINHLEDQLKLDEDGRPVYKVALLCGRPGLGKTTLAHVVAKQAGYNVIEINASDDRSVEVFKTSLENATQMKSVVDQQKRPNCVIFDEIDGAPTQSIEFLVKFVCGTVSKGRKKEKNNTVLKRPIICICNDSYVPALRSLRQIAFVVNFPPTSSSRLSERLIEISRWQQLQTDLSTMLALAEKSNNDIRSCLSLLHFFKVQNKPITLSDVYKSSIGQKDMQKGLFSVWTDIFTIERAKTKFFRANNGEKEDRREYDMSYKSRMNKILNVVQSFGDYDRLAQGVFENFPEMHVKDSSLEGTCCALDWFCYSDKLNKYIMTQQNYSLTSYLPHAFVVWHFQFASLVWPQIKYPNIGYEVRQKLTNNLATVRELMKGIQPKTKILLNCKSLILDILSPLIRIISPPFRPVNLHLFTPEEKRALSRVVDIMIDYNLTYVQDKNASGIYEFKLDPDVLPIIMYPSLPQQSWHLLSYFNKQLIAREIEIGKIKKFEAGSSSEGGGGVELVKETKRKQKSPLMSPEDQNNVPNHLKRLKAKSVTKVAPAVTKDFFGRIITSPEGSNKGPKIVQLENDIWYKYKEGYSNAVRKKIKISNLL